MKNMIKLLGITTFVALIGFSMAACQNPDGSEKTIILSFESFFPSSIFMENYSGERLVAFKGSLNPHYLISGIPAYAANHGLRKEDSIFNQTGEFALILITEAEYNNNKANLAAAPIFAEMYAFYNHEATNFNRFRISSKMGGTGRITVNNPTNWNIEIRRDGPTGEVLGYVAAQSNTVLRVNAPDDYSLYPVFKKYVSGDKEIYGVAPKHTSDALLKNKPYSKDFMLSAADDTSSWDLAEVAEKANFTLTSGSFYLRIVNNANTPVRFTRGDDEQITSMGIKGIAPANTSVYWVRIQRNPDGTYPASQEIAQLKIGAPSNPVAVPTHTFKLDYVYTITVTGADASNLALGEIQESDDPLDFEALFGY